nr:hypothetical protein [Arthrospira sp. PLM2.Bin9]
MPPVLGDMGNLPLKPGGGDRRVFVFFLGDRSTCPLQGLDFYQVVRAH